MKIVVAYQEKDRGIGMDNSIPWGLMKEDMALFKAITFGHTVVMGRKTWDSLPKKPLPYRRNLVLTRSSSFSEGEWITALESAPEDSIVLGGEEIYKLALDKSLVDVVIATVIKTTNFECNKFFPNLDGWKESKLLSFDKFDLRMYTKQI